MKYKFLKDLTSDVMFEAYGKTEKELFENSAEALMSVVCKIKKVKGMKEKSIVLTAKDIKELLFKWLQEIIALVDTEQMFFSKFVIESISDKELKAKICGEEIKPEKGETVVKAVTYYKFDVVKEKKGYKAVVALDI